ncbi:hypothetical protein Syun_016409 [Stephania yunnanensis]|uniref:peptidylprolyl isomerase n=1 Tax=Stephania yunnanensis TaxID=152371 RepID=A0AAP0P1D6_9MAGN
MELSLLPYHQQHHLSLLHKGSIFSPNILSELSVKTLHFLCGVLSQKTSVIIDGRSSFIYFIMNIYVRDVARAVSTSRRALRGEKIPESDFKVLPNGLKYYDLKVGSGLKAVKGSRVAVHYVAKWKGITFMTSRQGLGVGGGTPYGFDVGESERGNVLRGLDLGVEGMRVGGQRLLIVPPELAYGKKGVQEIPPNATIELNVELLSIKQSPFGTPVKIIR